MNSAKYISTRGKIAPISFQDAVMMGLAEDGGLLIPAEIPQVQNKLEQWKTLSYPELAFHIIRLFTGNDIPDPDLKKIIQKSYATFTADDVVPVKKLADKLYFAELFHGPTLAFKDIALQFLGNVFEYILQQRGGILNIIGATSGDTGSAAIHGVRGKKGIQIFIMYPDGRVSPLQERQMATVADKNVHCLAIHGTFDDGQRVMKEIFNDLPFKKEFSLGAINSVNWARILAQIVYYFWATFRVQDQCNTTDNIQVAVPTGNFGDIFAGYIAKKMGAPISRLILATNENDILSRFFTTGKYTLGEVHPTLSPSMDIQIASNFERYLYYRVHQDAAKTRALMAEFAEKKTITCVGADPDFAAGRGNTAQTLATIQKYYNTANYILDPHSAVGVAVAEQFQRSEPTVCLGTAHPGKFPAAIDEALGKSGLAKHEKLESLLALPLYKTLIEPTRYTIEQFVRENQKVQ
ncbi:MAG: threonine synthase [Lentisphaeria bacterium]